MAESSYAPVYGDLIYSIVRAMCPVSCVEIGVLNGYSAYYIAKALCANGIGYLDAYDLWESYPFKHSHQVVVQQYLEGCGVADVVTLHHCDALHVVGDLARVPDLVHIDISNDGDVYEWATNVFGRVLSRTGWLLLEGGTPERDQVEWMGKGARRSICPVLQQLSHDWHIFTFPVFPGLTMMRKR